MSSTQGSDAILKKAELLRARLGTGFRDEVVQSLYGEAERIARREQEKAERKARREAERKAAKPGKWAGTAARVLFVYLPLALVALVGIVHFINLRILAEPIEKLASDTIGEPVTIKQVHFSLFPQPRLTLGDVAVGADAGIKVVSIRISPDASTLFEEAKIVKSLEIEQLPLDAANLDRPMQWISTSASAGKLKIQQISLKNIAFKIPGLDLAPLDGRIDLSPAGDLRTIELSSADHSSTLRLSPQNGTYQVSLHAIDWQPPLGTRLQFGELSANGLADKHQVRFSRIHGRIYGGTFKAQGVINWSKQVSADGNFELENASLPLALSSMESKASLDGTLDASATFSCRSGEASTLVEAPQLSASFTLRNGKINGIDLAQSILAGGSRGNDTPFDKITGNLQLKNGLYQYRDLTLDAPHFHASGNLDIQQNQDISGRINAELAVPSRRIHTHFDLSGEVGGVTLE